MPTIPLDPLTRAKQIAAQEDAWVKAKADSNYESSVDAHFKDASARDLIKMHVTSRNLSGQKLSGFESRALYSAWLQRFGEREPLDYTPRAAVTPSTMTTATPLMPADDTVLSPKEVVRLAGVSLATIKRMVVDGRFPKPLRISERRIGWPAHEVKGWIAALDEQRHAPRQ